MADYTTPNAIPAPTAPLPATVQAGDVNWGGGLAPADINDPDYSDQSIAEQFAVIALSWTAAVLSLLTTAVQDQGLQSARKKRVQALNLYWVGKTKTARYAFSSLLFFISVQSNAIRLLTMNSLVADVTLRGAQKVVLDSLVALNSAKVKANASKMSALDLRAGFPDICCLGRMIIYGAQLKVYRLSADAHDKVSNCFAHVDTAPAPGNQRAQMTPTEAPGTDIEIPAWAAFHGACSMNFHCEFRNEIKQHAIHMWEDVIKLKSTGISPKFDDEWYWKTNATDYFALPDIWGATAPAAGATKAELVAYQAAISTAIGASTITAPAKAVYGSVPVV